MWQPVAKTLRTGVSGQAEELMRGYHNLSHKYITKVSGSTVTTPKKIDAKIVNDLRTATHEDPETVRYEIHNNNNNNNIHFIWKQCPRRGQ